MSKPLKLQTSITVNAPVNQVWNTLIDPKAIKQYLFGADIETDWKPGSAIRYTGEYNGKPYEEKGEILQFEPNKVLRTTNFSSMSGKEDKPENYDTVTYRVHDLGDKTRVTISQEPVKSQKALEGSKANWKMVLKSLKKLAEE